MDAFTKANLQADVSWSGFEFLIGAVFIILLFMSMYRVKNLKNAMLILFFSSLLFIYSTILFITPRIEGYSQRAAIEFFSSLKNKDIHVATLGYKSYAHLFYAGITPDEAVPGDTQELIRGETKKDVYVVFKINRKEKYLQEYPNLQVLYEKNGFVFTKKLKNDQ